MPHKDPEKRKAYLKKYNEGRKDKIKNYQDNNHNVVIVSNWKSYGIKLRDDEDWDSVYIQWFIQEKCDDCECELTFGSYGRSRKCLDHDHETGFIRGIVCTGCNLLRG